MSDDRPSASVRDRPAPSSPTFPAPRPVPSLDDLVVVPDRAARGRRRGRWLVEWAVVLVVAVALALVVRVFVAQMFYIPSGSMLPTLQVGDRIVVDKLSFDFGSVHRGDVVVFRRPPLEPANYSDLVKRVVGLPGDVLWATGGRLLVDGRPLAEPWLADPPPPTLPSPVPEGFSLAHPYRVPAGDYFVMGDNRTDSEDSRYFGPIPGSLIVGKVAFRVWPPGEADALIALGLVALALALALAVEWHGPAPPPRRYRHQRSTRRQVVRKAP